MMKRIFTVLLGLTLLLGIAPCVMAAGIQYQTVYEEDYTAADANTEGMLVHDFAVSGDDWLQMQTLKSVNNYSGTLAYPTDLGEGYRISGRYMLTWNSVFFCFMTDEPKAKDDGTVAVNNGYLINAHKKSLELRSLGADGGISEKGPDGWTDQSYESEFAYAWIDFTLTYEKGILHYSATNGTETREMTYDYTKGGTVTPKAGGYFAIKGAAADTLYIQKLKIEKVKNPIVTGQSASLSTLGCYTAQDTLQAWLTCDRTKDEVDKVTLWIDGNEKGSMTYAPDTQSWEGSVSLSGLTNGKHTVMAEVADIYGGRTKTKETVIMIGDQTAAFAGFETESGAVESLTALGGKTVTADFILRGECMAMVALTKDGTLLDLAVKKLSADDTEISLLLPAAVDGAELSAVLFHDFANPNPLCGAGVLR